MNIDTIYLDMDGVIVDFLAGCKAINAWNGGYKVDWIKIHAAGPEFWGELPWTKEGEKFYYWLETFCDEQGIELCILSQVGYQDGVTGKLEWIRNNCRVPNKNIYIVSKGKDKSKFANETSLLIDDFGKNVEAFIMAGGKAIKYKSAGQVKDELLDL